MSGPAGDAANSLLEGYSKVDLTVAVFFATLCFALC